MCFVYCDVGDIFHDSGGRSQEAYLAFFEYLLFVKSIRGGHKLDHSKISDATDSPVWSFFKSEAKIAASSHRGGGYCHYAPTPSAFIRQFAKICDRRFILCSCV